ncbi:MAG: helix-turn-helix transcriptional regulator [Planctomycetes bacterium]|nr:helix-turn-helix transcriptional regulator [Planctomycetota bacterium]
MSYTYCYCPQSIHFAIILMGKKAASKIDFAAGDFVVQAKSYSRKETEMLATGLTAGLRNLIQNCGRSQNQIARDTHIPQPVLSRFVNGSSLRIETTAVLLDYFGLEIQPKATARR